MGKWEVHKETIKRRLLIESVNFLEIVWLLSTLSHHK